MLYVNLHFKSIEDRPQSPEESGFRQTLIKEKSVLDGHAAVGGLR